MGISCATEIFQHVIQTRVLVGLKGVKNMIDDIIVYGICKEDHDRNLRKLLERLNSCGLTASEENCELGVNKLVFFGLEISRNGLKVIQSKIDALKNAGAPKTAGEVKSIMGLASYCSRQIPNLASISEPLRELTRDTVFFKWENKHQSALDKIKNSIVTNALAYFKLNWNTELTVDASPVGLAAVLAQINPIDKKERNIICFHSRLLTEVERRYSQVEKEALAVVWACERLRLYLIGHKFKLITDNRAIQIIFSNSKSKPPLRLERWALRMMDFDFEIIHKPGEYNIADYMSRNPHETVETGNLNDAERYINFVANHATPISMNRDEIVKATEVDKPLSALKKLITNQILSHDEQQVVKPYAKIINEFAITSDGLVMRGTRLVVPDALQLRCVKIAHEGHLGITKTKALIRSKLWFRKMDKLIENVIKGCLNCQLEGDGEIRPPIEPTTMPEEPWEQLAVDFYGPLKNGHHLMVLIDEHSRFPIVEQVNSTGSIHVIPILDKVFSMFGIPKVIKSDNGAPFNGKNFSEFCTYLGIKHRKITPYWPRANGQAENFMKNIGKLVRRTHVNKLCLEQELNKFLRCYRSTPHPATCFEPSKLIFGKSITCRLPNFSKSGGEISQEALKNDKVYKEKSRIQANDKSRANEIQLQIGDRVFFRQERSSKLQSKYSSDNYIITAINGSMITAENDDGSQITRNSSFFKKNNTIKDDLRIEPMDKTHAPTRVEAVPVEEAISEDAQEGELVTDERAQQQQQPHTTAEEGRPKRIRKEVQLYGNPVRY